MVGVSAFGLGTVIKGREKRKEKIERWKISE